MENNSEQSKSSTIVQWRDNVSKTVRARKLPDRLAGASSKTRPLRNPRRYLTEVSNNGQNSVLPQQPQSSRKRIFTMDKDENYNPNAASKPFARPRGRPRKYEKQQEPQRIPIRNDDTSSTLSESSRARSQSQKRSRSHKGRDFHEAVSVTSIDMARLEFCDPPVVKKTLREIKQFYRATPAERVRVDTAADLFWKLTNMPPIPIPSELKAIYNADLEDTPDKSRKSQRDVHFLDSHPYPPERLATLKQLVDNVLKKAAWNQKRKAHERQWGATISKLLEEVTLWTRDADVMVLNVENCTVEVEALRTSLMSGQILSYTTESMAGRSDGGSEEPNQTMTKMVDWALTLELDPEDEDIVNRAFNTLSPNECSLNQCLSYIRKSAIFTNLEIKKQAGSDPELQLALWESAALKKKRWHGWATSLPLPGIYVEGHVWHWCLF
ncbi:MAG: hypothetical protein Q9180_005192, partial [Flavoplaca navasiana]